MDFEDVVYKILIALCVFWVATATVGLILLIVWLAPYALKAFT